MSVTFTADWRPAGHFVVSCGCERATALAPRHDTYEEALAALPATGSRDPLPGCAMPDICPDYPLYVHDVDSDGDIPEVNLSEPNAVRLAELLGLLAPEPSGADTTPALSATAREDRSLPGAAPDTTGPWHAACDAGRLPAGDFLGRVLVALALTPEDSGVDGYWSGRIHMGGRRAGYLQRRLAELRDLAQWCADHGRDVTWG
ncbi:hypothetical protein ACFW6N_32690 [Streptomyces cyaneofuscatus]|uniref:hypothetical protein n=1 Tax=Streptomyces cyaneofuscatus TaxID=66883 RepID=UPI00369B9620